MTNLKTNITRLTFLATCIFIAHLSNAQMHIVKGEIIDGEAVGVGDVGIGTDTPTQKLDVHGSVNITGGLLKTGSTEPNEEGFTVSRIQVGKNISDGSTSGIAYIDLFPSQARAGRLISRFENGKASTSFHNNGEGNFSIRTWGRDAAIGFTTAGGDTPTKLIILSNGNIGMSTSTPTAKLEVNGSAKKPGGGEWATTSDKRTKKNINQYEAGLEDVLKLNPVTFNYNGKAGISDTEKTHVGLIAQEFAEIAPYAVDKFDYTEEGSNKTDEYMSLDASSIKYMLVNAIKEQQAKIESLEEKLTKLATNGLSPATPGASEMSVLLEGNGTESGLLSQNSPNPFRTNTRIEYFIPQNSKHCRLSFRDMNGKELKQVDIEHEGIGAIDLTSKDLAAGIYSYVLYVNGDIVASKKMILRQ